MRRGELEARFDELRPGTRHTEAGKKAFKFFAQWSKKGHCVLLSTEPKRLGMVVLKVPLHDAVKIS